MDNEDLGRVRGLCNRLGVVLAARALGVHRTSLIALIGGSPIRPNTEKVILAALNAGVTDSAGSNGSGAR